MANTIMTNIYNHYMTTYSPKKSDARLDSHDTNQLKRIYNNILKRNKEAPLYLYDRSKETASFALSLKENTRQLQHTILNTAGRTETDFFQNRIAFSADEDMVSVRYIGKEASEDDKTYEIEVQNLACGQINLGAPLPADESELTAGSYSFDVNTGDTAYEFQFNVSDGDTNLEILTKLEKLFQHANIGLTASVLPGADNTCMLRIASNQTGEGKVSGDPLFTIQNTTPDTDHDVVDYLGIDYIAQSSADAHFVLNHEAVSSPSNQFTIDDAFEVTLHKVSPESGEPVKFGLKANVDSLKDNIHNLIGGYNSFLQAADEYQSRIASQKLSFEMKNVARLYRSELDTIGVNITDNGNLAVDDTLLTQTAQSEDAYALLSPLKNFSSSLYEKGEEISRDPLNYANQKIVAYKNPGKNFTSPYAASSYSGLLFNYYC